METVWTGELIGNLTRLWNEGHSMAEIGRRLGVSKNAVVSKAHRIHLTPRESPLKAGPCRHHEPRPALTAGATTGSCCWPTGHPGDSDFGFCGNATVAGKPYCAEHAAKAYTGKPTPVHA